MIRFVPDAERPHILEVYLSDMESASAFVFESSDSKNISGEKSEKSLGRYYLTLSKSDRHDSGDFNSYEKKTENIHAVSSYLVKTDESRNKYSLITVFAASVKDSVLKEGKQIFIKSVIKNPVISVKDSGCSIITDESVSECGYSRLTSMDDLKNESWYRNSMFTEYVIEKISENEKTSSCK